MSQLFKTIVTVLALAAFGMLVAVFATSLGRGAPNQITTPAMTSDTAICAQVGEWTTHADPANGFTFQYPSESRVETARPERLDIFLRPQCYTARCWGSNHLVVKVLDNPERLSVEAYLQQTFEQTDASTTFTQSRGTLSSVADVEAWRFEEGLGNVAPKPDVFVPHQDKILRFYMDIASPVPPHDPPCEATLQLFNDTLSSLQLNHP